jgi:hypothetical protein
MPAQFWARLAIVATVRRLQEKQLGKADPGEIFGGY